MTSSEQIVMLRNTVDEFGRNELLHVGYSQLEPKGEFPSELVAKISQMGLMGISFPEEYGGMGMNTVATSVVGERLAFYWPSLQLIWSANVSLAGFPIMTFGTERQKQRFLPRLASGEILGCYALTEPDAGSDAANIKTSAEESLHRGLYGPEYILKGTKTFITNANNASVGIVFARIAGEKKSGKRHEGITAFIIKGSTPGSFYPTVTSVRRIEKWGLRSSHFCEIVINGPTGDDNMLGEAGNGFHIAMATLNNGRINIAAQAVGIARRALFEAERYGNGRVAFGKPVIKMRTQADRLKRLEQKVERARELTFEASRAKDSGEEYRVEAARAKLYASETAVQCAMFNYRISGGFGYTTESIAMSILHDALATITYEGTSDIQRLTIARSLRD